MTTALERLASARRCSRDGVEYVSAFDVPRAVSGATNVRKLWRDVRLQHERLLDGAWTRVVLDGAATPAIAASHVLVLVALVPGVAAARVRGGLAARD